MSGDGDTYYSPARLDGILRRWPEWLALAETPRSARHLNDPACQPGRACSYGAPVGIRDSKGHHHDQLRGADVVADVERAWGSLRYGSLEWQVINYRLMALARKRWRHPNSGEWQHDESRSLSDIARTLGRRYQDVLDANKAALRQMAEFLGWREEMGS